MIGVICPKCDRKLGFDDSKAGTTGTCPACGKSFRVTGAPGSAVPVPRTAPRRASPAVAPVIKSPAEPPEVVAEEDTELEVVVEIDDDPPVEAATTTEEAAAQEAVAEVDSEPEDEAAPKEKKKKKKKRKSDQVSGFERFAQEHGNLLVAGIMLGLGVLLVIGFVLYSWLSGPSTPEGPPDPAPAIAFIRSKGGSVLYDPNDPQTVISVSLGGTTVEGKELTCLRAFPKLRTLNLSHCHLVKDLGMQHVAKLTELRELVLRGTGVSDGAMSYVANLVNLEKLDLSQTIVTDGGLEQLKGLTKLKELGLADDALASGLGLKAALPHLQIIK
jgi:hypothetical protein